MSPIPREQAADLFSRRQSLDVEPVLIGATAFRLFFPAVRRHTTGGSYPWRLDGGRRTVVHIKNTTGQLERALIQIRWAGGSYNPEALTFGPWESAALDLERLQASGEPDILGTACRMSSSRARWCGTRRATAR